MNSVNNTPLKSQSPINISQETIDLTGIETETIGCVAEQCTECGVCVRECDFLQQYGTPGKIAKSYLSGDEACCRNSYYCNLCGLCSAVCPANLAVKEMFISLRRAAVRQGDGHFKGHKSILNYEKIGSSRAFSCLLLPDCCTTVFFPGCTLPAIRPKQTLELFDFLNKQIPRLGFVLNCCNKPSHDLGRQQDFLENFGRKIEDLRDHGVKKVITVCPNCFQIFRKYGGDIKVTIAYSHLRLSKELATDDNCQMRIEPRMCTVHDPCVLRFDPEIQQEVRQLAKGRGLAVTEMAHNGRSTQCCGEGGAVSNLTGGKGNGWKKKRLNEAGSLLLLTYCAGCTVAFLPRESSHILDILFPGKDVEHKVIKPTRFPFTYLNRLQLKRKLTKQFRKAGGTFPFCS